MDWLRWFCHPSLAHEWAHAFGCTDDNVYGETANKNLSRSNADKAVDNNSMYAYGHSQF